MTSFDELKATIRLNQLLGMWAAEKLGLSGAEADNYAKALAVDTIAPARNDVFSRIRRPDFRGHAPVRARSRRDAASNGRRFRCGGGDACPQAYDTVT
jgi:hypothetical protein